MAHQLRRSFNPGPAPPNYVPGVGRGAQGFTTRSDIGPAGNLMPGAAATGAQAGAPAEGGNTFDEFSGYSERLFSRDPYDADDQEADQIWESVDARMDERRREHRDARLRSELAEYRRVKPKIQLQFADLKKDLSKVSDEEWAAIPEIGDRSLRHKRPEPSRFVPVPDSVLAGTLAQDGVSQTAHAGSGGGGGGGGDTRTDLTQVGSAQRNLVEASLTQASQSVHGQTVVDSTGYLTDLASLRVQTDAEMVDIKKLRELLGRVTKSNTQHAPGWIAAARLEEVAGRMVAARKVILRACTHCPTNEDVWLEAARLSTPENARILFGRAVRHIPTSVKLWLHAANLEHDVGARKRVLRRGLELIPDSIPLWKAAIELEESQGDALLLLSRAVECVPSSVDMWLALAHLETYENARKVLNKARETIPTEPSIWITAAKLEEANGNGAAASMIIGRALTSLGDHGVVVQRERWLQDAEAAERAGSLATCRAIVEHTLDMGVEPQDRKRTWLEDAQQALGRGAVETARAIYERALAAFPQKKSIWLRAAHLEKEHGSPATVCSVLDRAVKACPQSEVLWLMAAKEKWMGEKSVEGARAILKAAFAANPGAEAIWLAAVKLESANGEQQRARTLLARARERAGTLKVWLRSARLERTTAREARASSSGAKARELAQAAEAAEQQLLTEASQRWPQAYKPWLLLGQASERRRDVEEGRKYYQRGLRNCPQSIRLWLALTALELGCGQVARARSVLEKARVRLPRTPELWLHAVQVELEHGDGPSAASALAKGLQECPDSGLLWAQAIRMAPMAQKRSKCTDALRRCANDAYVILAAARVFWAERRMGKVRTWLERALAENPELGDAWAALYQFERTHGKPGVADSVQQRCEAAAPTQGILWRKVSKDPAKEGLTTVEVLHVVAPQLAP